MLRKHGVVGRFVEFYGPGVASLSLADRATIANMAPEYGATCGFFGADDKTLDYMRLTGRSEEQISLVEAYSKQQGLWFDPANEPVFNRSDERLVGKYCVSPCRSCGSLYLVYKKFTHIHLKTI